MEIDVRVVEQEVTILRFADANPTYSVANGIVKGKEYCRDVTVQDIEGDDEYLRILSKEHALNLIKALNKAIELGWFKE